MDDGNVSIVTNRIWSTNNYVYWMNLEIIPNVIKCIISTVMAVWNCQYFIRCDGGRYVINVNCQFRKTGNINPFHSVIKYGVLLRFHNHTSTLKHARLKARGRHGGEVHQHNGNNIRGEAEGCHSVPHPNNLYTTKRGSIGRHENCSKSKVDGNLIFRSFTFPTTKSYHKKKKSMDPGLTPFLDIG
jgi:hypothetical protein